MKNISNFFLRLWVCFVLVTFCGSSVSAKSLSSIASESQIRTGRKSNIRCSCTVMANMMDDSPYHTFGVIQTYLVKHVDPQCHHIQHNCVKACALRSQIGTDVAVNKPLGMKLCERLGIPTADAGSSIRSYASLLSDDDDAPCMDERRRGALILQPQSSKEKLCCGFTFIDSEEHKRFGWNPDCEGRTYLLI